MPDWDLVIKGARKGPKEAGRDPMRELAEFATGARLSDLPSNVVERGSVVLLDTIGVILGGSVEPQVKAMAGRFACQENGVSTIIGYPICTTALNAVLVNGTAATWLDFDSGHRAPPGKPLLPAAHPPVHIVPAVLALAEELGSSGEEVLTAMVLGYEIGARIGMSSRVKAQIHCHGTHHNVSAAVAACRLMGGGGKMMERTIGLAVHLSLMPSFENPYQGGTIRNMYAAAGGMAGLLAARLARIGFTPERDPLGSVYGNVISQWLDRGRLLDGLGSRYEISLGFVKPYPMCRFGHPAVEAAEALIGKYPLTPSEIEVVEVYTFDWAATLDDPAPTTDLGAKFSVPWAVACMLVKKTAGAEDFRTASLDNPDIKSVAAKVRLREDPGYSALTPDKRPARIIVKTKSGETYQWEVERSRGGPEAPLPLDVVLRKFRSMAEPVLGRQKAASVLDHTLEIARLKDIREVTGLLRPEKETQ